MTSRFRIHLRYRVKIIHFQYYTLVVLIQIKYFCNSEEAEEEAAAKEISRGRNSSQTNTYFQKPIMQDER